MITDFAPLECLAYYIGTMEKKKTVVIGMTGRINSSVAAYLLKKQGFNCIGLSVVLTSDDQLNGVLTDCQVTDLQRCKEICDKLGIPFYAVKAEDRFRHEVTDFAVSARLSGSHFQPCINCHNLKADVLLNKLEELGADYFATGHFAKKQFNQNTGQYSLLIANDRDRDQSYLLSTLDQCHLEKILFPLGDMQESEIMRVVDTMGNDRIDLKPKKKICFTETEAICKFIEQDVAPNLRLPGALYIDEDESFFTDCAGVHYYSIGQNNLRATGPSPIDPHYRVVRISTPLKAVYISMGMDLTFSRLLVERFKLADGFNTSKPLAAYARCHITDEFRLCTVYFKSNDHVVLEFDSAQNLHLTTGDFVAVYNKSTSGSRLLGGGQIKAVGHVKEIAEDIEKKRKEAEGIITNEEKNEKKVDKVFVAF